MSKKILIVVTSCDAVPHNNHPTGIWIEEFTTPWYQFTDQGYNVTIASPKGGKAPIDPKSTRPEFSTPSVKRFFQDSSAQQQLDHTVPLSSVQAKDYDAIFYPGGHGPMWDLVDNTASIQLIENFYEAGKPVALVCHAPAALKNVKNKNGLPLVHGKQVAGFANSEEVAGQTTQEVPFMLEDMLKEKQAIYVKGADWQPFAVTAGNLITGQNPASAVLVGEKVMAALQEK
ncbi:MAG: type 1 glutamine amidotransferase domain-containing protein [Chitinophaga sp.]|uniref:type 1 glutamine amidotransferase domain-containing protein n=1 Tax=Chitinophaga sp. TaxID=1869181 RepID=UPI001B1161D6|nr:type 1 glutamine amidotransferase domain-containing protein [Chitinophaga sp.]MBO9728306.1 type 1 glutamine amidotransferase domain-containing protein [Chitinophaga sp.]